MSQCTVADCQDSKSEVFQGTGVFNTYFLTLPNDERYGRAIWDFSPMESKLCQYMYATCFI